MAVTPLAIAASKIHQQYLLIESSKSRCKSSMRCTHEFAWDIPRAHSAL